MRATGSVLDLGDLGRVLGQGRKGHEAEGRSEGEAFHFDTSTGANPIAA